MGVAGFAGGRGAGLTGRGRRGTVLVLGAGARAAQGTARSLARAGFRVVGAGVSGRLAGRTRYYDQLERVPHSSDPAALAAAVAGIVDREQVRVILPMFDELQAVLLTHPDAVGEAALGGPTFEELRRLGDKVGLIESAQAAGIQMPETAVVDGDSDRSSLPPLPSYVKIVTSMYDGRPAGRPFRVTERRLLDELLEQLVGGGDTVVVQQEVDGRQWRCDFVRGRNVLVALASRQLCDWPYRVGQSTVLEFGEMPEQLSVLCRRLLDAVDYVGPGSIQFIERGDEWFLHDVNLRMPACVAGVIAAGFDLPVTTVELALGTQPEPVDLPRRRFRYVWLEGEARAFRDTVAGKPSGRSPAQICGSVLLAAVSPRRRLVPFDVTDPLPTLAALSAAIRRPRSGVPA